MADQEVKTSLRFQETSGCIAVKISQRFCHAPFSLLTYKSSRNIYMLFGITTLKCLSYRMLLHWVRSYWEQQQTSSLLMRSLWLESTRSLCTHHSGTSHWLQRVKRRRNNGWRHSSWSLDTSWIQCYPCPHVLDALLMNWSFSTRCNLLIHHFTLHIFSNCRCICKSF